MQVRTRAFWLPKAGNAVEDYEDACRPRRSLTRRLHGFRCAMADGATESSFAGLWAQMLVDLATATDPTPEAVERRLARLREEWWTQVSARPLPWYAEEKVRSGAFSTLLACRFREDQGNAHWQSLALGDSCLFQVREERLVASTPLTHPAQFSSRPFLLSSRSAVGAPIDTAWIAAGGDCLPGDRLYLMTDAMAFWFLGEARQERLPWAELDNCWRQGGVALRRWVQSLRAGGQMRNDDVTVLRIAVE